MTNFNTNVDYISTLPKEIIHNIMGRLPMLDTVRTSCLSNAWKSYGVSLPYLNIDHNHHDPPHCQWFKDFMARKVSSMRAQGEDFAMYKFKLCLDHSIVHGAKEEVERCIELVSKTETIREFDFQITRDAEYIVRGDTRYPINHIYNSEALNVLRLGGLTLEKPSGDMKLSNLQSLNLIKVNVDIEYGIGWLFSSCPLIREIRLVDCTCLDILKVSGLSHLKHLEISSCCALTRVEIRTPGLEKLMLTEIRRVRLDGFVLAFEIDLQTCETLRELTLRNCTIRGSTFSRTFSGCRNVESLMLDRCHHFFKIRIASQKLRNLVVRRCSDLLITEIDAPNLTSFNLCSFCWEDYPLYNFPNIEKIIHQQECILDFSITLVTKSLWTSLWFDKFNDTQGQKMVIYPEKTGSYSVTFVLEDWSCIAELPLMTKICEEATKTIITTMSFLDLADYVLESNKYGGNKLENVITISSTDESRFYEAMKMKRPTISCIQCSSMADIEVDAFLSEWCDMPWFSSSSSDDGESSYNDSVNNNIDDGFPYQALLQKWINRTLKATQFSISS